MKMRNISNITGFFNIRQQIFHYAGTTFH